MSNQHVILGNYRLNAQIGAGGMGVVYAAEHLTLGRRAAIKVLLPELSRNREMVSRFFTEARAAAAIDHPGLVSVFDLGAAPDGSAYIVMELLAGETLAARLEREGRLSVDDAVALTRQVATAVGSVHRRGIVHRDLKPANVFLVRDPELAGGARAKVLDFGIAKLTEETGRVSVRTRTGAMMGTPLYMSPEQCHGAGTVDARSDIYSLGCMLFEMLAGRPPFADEGVGALISSHMFIEPPSIAELAPDAPPWLHQVVMRTLAKRPEDRQPTMDELALALGGAGTIPPRGPTGPRATPATRSYPIVAVSPTGANVAHPRRGRHILVVAAAVAAVAAVAAIAGTRSSPPVVTPAPTPVVAVIEPAPPPQPDARPAEPDAAVPDAATRAPVVVIEPKPAPPRPRPKPRPRRGTDGTMDPFEP